MKAVTARHQALLNADTSVKPTIHGKIPFALRTPELPIAPDFPKTQAGTTV